MELAPLEAWLKEAWENPAYHRAMGKAWEKQGGGEKTREGPATATRKCVVEIGAEMLSPWKLRIGGREIDIRETAPRTTMNLAETELRE